MWVPFHCVPLFAALDSLKRDQIGPTRPRERRDPPNGDVDAGTPPASVTNLAGGTPVIPPAPAAWRELPPAARPGAPPPAWLKRDTWTVLDLPGPMAVEAAAWLVSAARCQPVCTFDNWPHARGVLRAEATLAELLRWATTVAVARPSLDAGSPPLWICDSERLGAMPPKPREFDNRYYLDDSILPGPGLLRQGGIREVVYVTVDEGTPAADLDLYLRELLAAGLPVWHVSVLRPGGEPSSLRLLSTPSRRPSGFRRSSAGGFGQDVPDPSSGGSGG